MRAVNALYLRGYNCPERNSTELMFCNLHDRSVAIKKEEEEEIATKLYFTRTIKE
jgi:hypothetical protein